MWQVCVFPIAGRPAILYTYICIACNFLCNYRRQQAHIAVQPSEGLWLCHGKWRSSTCFLCWSNILYSAIPRLPRCLAAMCGNSCLSLMFKFVKSVQCKFLSVCYSGVNLYCPLCNNVFISVRILDYRGVHISGFRSIHFLSKSIGTSQKCPVNRGVRISGSPHWGVTLYVAIVWMAGKFNHVRLLQIKRWCCSGHPVQLRKLSNTMCFAGPMLCILLV